MAGGILILRLALGLTMAGHGAQKLFGWFGGGGIEETGKFFQSLGLRPGKVNALVAGLSEAIGGVLIAAGLLTPLGAAAIIGVMVAAIAFVHLRHGFFAQSGGVEYPLMLAVTAAAIGYVDPGTYSLDHLIGWTLSGAAWGSGAVGLGVVAAGAVTFVRWAVAQRSARGTVMGVGRRHSRRLAA